MENKSGIIDKLIEKYCQFCEEKEGSGILEEWASEANGEQEFIENRADSYIESQHRLVLEPCHRRIIAIANRLGISEEDYNFHYNMLLP